MKIKPIRKSKEKEIIKITSKLILISEKNKTIKELFNYSFNSIKDEEEVELIGKIIYYTFENYELSNFSMKLIFEFLLGNFDEKNIKIIKLFIGKKIFFPKLDIVLKDYVIEDKDFFLEKNFFNYTLLYNLYQFIYFELYKNSSYSIKTK